MTTPWPPPLCDATDVQIVVRWRDGRASVAEVAAVRKLSLEWGSYPASEVFQHARSTDKFVLVTCPYSRSWQWYKAAEHAGLVVEVEVAPVEPLPPVPDEEVVAELTYHGHAVTDFFLVGGLVCHGIPNGSFAARRINDAALSSATKAYLMRVGAPCFASYEEFMQARLPGGA